MSLIAWYKFNDTATFLVDSSGNSNTLTDVNGVDSFDDPTYGIVASFSNSPTNYFSLAAAPVSTTGSNPRTFSYWIRQIGNETYRIIHGQGVGGPELRVQFSSNKYDINGGSGRSPNNAPSVGSWAHISLTYDGTTERTYFNGSLNRTVSIAYNTAPGPLFIGSATNFTSGFSLNGYILDFRIYDGALSDTEINTLYTDGPGLSPLRVEPQVSSVSVTIGSVDGATGYRLTLQQTGSSTISIVKDNFTDLNQVITNLIPGTEYTISLFSTTGTGFDFVESSVVNTLANSASNYNVNDFINGSGRFDLSAFNTTSFGLISEVMNDLFTTGDSIDINVPGSSGSKTSIFVNTGGTVSVTDSDAIIAPFSISAGPGQSVSLTLSDTSTVPLSFDETTQEVSVDGTPYSVGDSLVLDGKKVTIVDI